MPGDMMAKATVSVRAQKNELLSFEGGSRASTMARRDYWLRHVIRNSRKDAHSVARNCSMAHCFSSVSALPCDRCVVSVISGLTHPCRSLAVTCAACFDVSCPLAATTRSSCKPGSYRSH